MKVSIAYTETCLPDYFGGDSRPWVAIYTTEKGYTSRELRKEILNEFRLNAVGGSHWITAEYIPQPEKQKLADRFYSKLLPACLNREIKYRGKAAKLPREYLELDDDFNDCPVLFIVFNIEE